MTYLEVLKRLIKEFRDFIWYKKLILIMVVWIITTIIASLEPFFWATWIWYIEDFLVDWNINTQVLVYFFAIWFWYIIINSFIRYYYRYHLIDVNALKFYVYNTKKYKDKILNITQWVFLEKKWWKFYKILDRWTESMFMSTFILFIDIFISLTSIVIISTVIFFVNYKLAIATLFVVPIFIYLWYYFNNKTRKKQQEIHKKWEKFYWDLGDYVTNLTLTKVLWVERFASKKLDKNQDENLALQIPLSKKWAIADIYTAFAVNISRFIVLAVWIYLILSWEIGFWTLFLFYTYIGYIYFPLSFIFWNLKNLQKNLESIKKLYEEFDEIEQDNDLEWAKDLEKVDWHIEFKNINFWYSNKIKTLKNIDFKINPWEKVALVWSTWSWKSTITNLLLRFWDNYEWEILIDWKNIKSCTKSSIRKHIWIVMQDNSLFNTTIKENMLLANPEASDDEIKLALKNAQADFVLKQKDWLDTVIWERWLKLSGWEKQRINIARIFLKNPEILILDEATSALDNKTEIEIQNSLENLMKNKTSIVIAHRLSTIKKVDKIFVVDAWEIVESWTYDELISKWWKFYWLANPDKLIIN